MKIAIGADHAGYGLKDRLAQMLGKLGHEVADQGTFSSESVDYPDYAERVARAVSSGMADRGLLVCGTGLGMAITANKISGVRAVTCGDSYSARMARAHNDANVLTLGARVIGDGLAEEITREFVDTPFEAGRHAQRVGKINALD